MTKRWRLETQLVHGGELRPRVRGAATLPIFQSTVFESRHAVGHDQIVYPRLNNLPIHEVLGAKLAALEGAEAGLVLGSGMAAITSALLSVLGPGDHVLLQAGVYGGSHTFLTEELPRLGIGCDLIDADDPEQWERLCRAETKAVFVESLTNPLLRVIDHRKLVDFARRRNLVSIVDNTLATPVLFRAGAFGYDLVVHSATKYLNGHSDVVAGVVAGSAERVYAARRTSIHYGGTLDPHAAFLLHRGLLTLGLRVRHQSRTARALAEFLEHRPEVKRVHYPSLASHPDRARASELFDGGAGGLLSFELAGGAEAAERLLDRVELPLCAPSLGGPETLLTRPVTSSHSGLTQKDRERAGIDDALLRMAVGFEAPEDLIADLDRALGEG